MENIYDKKIHFNNINICNIVAIGSIPARLCQSAKISCRYGLPASQQSGMGRADAAGSK